MTALDEYGPEQAAQPKTGRPTDYAPDLAETICGRLVDGESLRSICAAEDMPDKSTVFRWLGRHDAFRDQYARAREAQADRLFEECLEIADDDSGDWTTKETDSGQSIAIVDHEHISRSKLRVDTRKWMAGKLRPKTYGDRVVNEHTGEIRVPANVTDAELDNRIAAAFAEHAALGTPGAGDEVGKPAGGENPPGEPQQTQEPLP